jgi:hypothetical protein
LAGFANNEDQKIEKISELIVGLNSSDRKQVKDHGGRIIEAQGFSFGRYFKLSAALLKRKPSRRSSGLAYSNPLLS